MTSDAYLTHVLEDGAKIAYEILGSHHIGFKKPIVLVSGMRSLRGDCEKLTTMLASNHPGMSSLILIYDHRGMGDSTMTPGKDEVITMESLARDLFSLLFSLRWKYVSLCGFSMGGVVAQQLLFLPYHESNPTPLPFIVTHVLLTGALCSALNDPHYILRINAAVPDTPPTHEEKREVARKLLEPAFDPYWITVNEERFEWWVNRMTFGRPIRVVLMQGRALGNFHFDGLYNKLSKDVQFLVIHGKLDKIVPLRRGEECLKLIPWAKIVEAGSSPGQVPHHNFGHIWFEYFDIQVWQDAIEQFLGQPKVNSSGTRTAHL